MTVAGLVDGGRAHVDAGEIAVHAMASGVVEDGPRARQHGMVAVFQIGDAVGERCQRDGVRADEHLPVAMPGGQRAALARGNHQIALAVEQEGQRERPFELRQRGAHCLQRAHARAQVFARQQGHGLGVGVAFGMEAARGQPVAQAAVVLDDAVMDHGNRPVPVRMGILARGGAMGGPAGVADAAKAGQRVMDQRVRQVDQLAHRPPARQMPRGIDCSDPG